MSEKVYNNWPKGFDQKKLKKGEKVVFELVHKSGPFGLPSRETVAVDAIDNETGELETQLVDIAIIKNQTANGEITLQSAWFDWPSLQIICIGGKPKDEKVYNQLIHSNFFEGNPNRDNQFPAAFRLYEPAKKAAADNIKIIEAVQAQGIVAAMSETEVRKYFSANGQSSTAELPLLIERLLKIAKKEPQKFLKNKGGLTPDENILGVFNEAKNAGFIKFETTENGWAFSDTGDVFVTIGRALKKGEKRTDCFMPFMKKAEGREVYNKLKVMLEDVE